MTLSRETRSGHDTNGDTGQFLDATLMTMAAAMSARIERDGLHGMKVEDVDAFENASVALDALRALPVEQRMEAMGMRPMRSREAFDRDFDVAWVEADA